MENFNKIWRAFFAIGLIGLAVQQFIFADFRPVMMPPGFPAWLAPRSVWAYLLSVALIGAGIAILFDFKARAISLLAGTLLLVLTLVFHTVGTPYPAHIGSWTNAFKDLTLSGGFFVVAGSFRINAKASDFIKLLDKIIPAGKYFLAITLILFGFMHFVYPDFCAPLVPNWIPWHYFWMYFGGIALIAGGLGIAIKPTQHLAAFWTGIMLFIWVFILHLPRAIAAPATDMGNEWSSVFEALAFSGIAFVVSGRQPKDHF